MDSKQITLEKFSYWTMPMLYVFGYVCASQFNNPWLFVMFAYYLVPFVDKYLQLDELNPTFEQQKELSKDLFYKYPLYACVLFEWLYSIWSVYFFLNNDLSLLFLSGFIIQCGVMSTSNINVSHELMHKKSKLDQSTAWITLLRNQYTHFALEHTKGHHFNVSTPNDAASARYNQTIYQFFKQTLVGTFNSAIELEDKRLKEKSLCYIHHNIYFFWIIQIFYNYFCFEIFGFKGAIFFHITGIFGVLFLEIINYIEHYGLERKEISPGVYEKVTIMHSWNAPYKISNAIVFKLQRHSDHHENAYKEYQSLCSYQESPLLPQSYSVLIMLAVFPSKWFEVLNPIIESYKKEGKLTQKIKEQSEHKLNVFLTQAGSVLAMINMAYYML